MDTLIKDVRFGLRMLLKRPGFTAIAIITLAVAIGANSAIFSVVNAVLLQPFPYKEPDRLVQFWETNPLKGWTQANVAPANFYDWQKQAESFEGMAAYFGSDTKDAGLSGFHLTGGSEPVRIEGLGVSGNLFQVLGVEAAIGRTFFEEETWQGKHLVVLLSHDLWQRRFGGNPEIVGQSISLNGRDRTVVGVMPGDFYFPHKDVEMWVPFGFTEQQMVMLRRPHFLRAVGRLKPGVTLEQARAEMTSIMARLEEQYPDTNTQMGAGLGLLHEWVVEDTRLAVLVFLAAVAFVLLIACANVANLLLARAASRSKEIAVRVALGSSRSRLVRQLMTESLLLAAAGGGTGLLLAVWFKDMLIAFNPGNIPRLADTALDGRVIAFTIGITVLTTALFGLLPALQSSKTDLIDSLKEGGQKGGAGTPGGRARNILVIAEVALSLVLIAGAGLMIKSFLRLQQVDTGFNPDNVLTLRLSLTGPGYQDDKPVQDFYTQLEDRIKSLPGVVTVGATSTLPLKGYRWTGDFTIEGRSPEDYGKEVRHKEISPGYFEAVGLPMLRGRSFTESDTAGSPSVIVINEALARKHFQNEDPVGKRLTFNKPTTPGPWHTIIGVVADERQEGMSREVMPQIYQSHLQNAINEMSLVIKTAVDPNSIVGAVRNEIRLMDKDLPPYEVQTLNELLYSSVARERFSTMLMVAFAGVALLLAAVGIYGVMSYSVTQRTHEMGIRLALGARPNDLVRLVVGRGLALTLAGVGIGLVSSLLLTQIMQSLLFGVSATDPLTFIAVSALLSAVALFACYIPARRAARVDPMIALRYE
ncbi:MAG TPA: ABC transporter permease [Blastocatellia bacterium]|nr:ABC transporter permease [Blastocatellia bacterium]